MFATVFSVAQITIVSLFLVRSRGLKEINLLTKMMMVVAAITSVFHLLWSLFIVAGIDATIFYYLGTIFRIANNVNYSLMFRFIRLQVQLKASEENSKIIMSTIKRSKQIENFVNFDLIIYTCALLVKKVTV